MKRRAVIWCSTVWFLAVMVSSAPPRPALAQGVGPDSPSGPRLTALQLTQGVETAYPVLVTAPAGDYRRIFIVQQRIVESPLVGRVLIYDLDAGRLNAEPFLDVAVDSTYPEQGLLGFAFAPDYASSGRFYMHYIAAKGPPGTGPWATHIVRGTVSSNPDIANPELELLLEIPGPSAIHNGGWIEFGPDGYLYVSQGENGFADQAQNINLLHGKILRIDVGVEGGYAIPATNPFVGLDGADEVWAYGLRNPWRAAFDELTGHLYIGDVGQGIREEIDFQPFNPLEARPGDRNYQGGRNYGWPCMEGNICIGDGGACLCDDPALIAPIHIYSNAGANQCAVVGGRVYRGHAMPALHGAYFFADFCDGIWSFRYDGAAITQFTDRKPELAFVGGEINNPTSFGRDAAGELYMMDISGGDVFKIVPACPADLAAPFQVVNVADLLTVIRNWGRCPTPCPPHCATDIVRNCAVDASDLLAVIANWGPCP